MHLPPSVTVEVSNKLRLESLPDPSSMSESSPMPKSLPVGFGDEFIKDTSLDMITEVEIVAAKMSSTSGDPNGKTVWGDG